MGIEPTRSCPQQFLRLPRIPIPPPGHDRSFACTVWNKPIFTHFLHPLYQGCSRDSSVLLLYNFESFILNGRDRFVGSDFACGAHLDDSISGGTTNRTLINPICGAILKYGRRSHVCRTSFNRASTYSIKLYHHVRRFCLFRYLLPSFPVSCYFLQ